MFFVEVIIRYTSQIRVVCLEIWATNISLHILSPATDSTAPLTSCFDSSTTNLLLNTTRQVVLETRIRLCHFSRHKLRNPAHARQLCTVSKIVSTLIFIKSNNVWASMCNNVWAAVCNNKPSYTQLISMWRCKYCLKIKAYYFRLGEDSWCWQQIKTSIRRL